MVSSGTVSETPFIYEKAHNWGFLSTATAYTNSFFLGRTGRSSWLFCYVMNACPSTHLPTPPPAQSASVFVCGEDVCLLLLSTPSLNNMWQHLGHHG